MARGTRKMAVPPQLGPPLRLRKRNMQSLSISRRKTPVKFQLGDWVYTQRGDHREGGIFLGTEEEFPYLIQGHEHPCYEIFAGCTRPLSDEVKKVRRSRELHPWAYPGRQGIFSDGGICVITEVRGLWARLEDPKRLWDPRVSCVSPYFMGLVFLPNHDQTWVDFELTRAERVLQGGLV